MAPDGCFFLCLPFFLVLSSFVLAAAYLFTIDSVLCMALYRLFFPLLPD